MKMIKDDGAISGYIYSVFTIMIIGFLIMLSTAYSSAVQVKLNIETAQVSSCFSGFRISEKKYISDGSFVVSNELFKESCEKFLYYLKKNLQLTHQEDKSFTLIPDENSLIASATTQGEALFGKVEEIKMYVVNGEANTNNKKIEIWTASSSGQSHDYSVAQNISYDGQVIAKLLDFQGNKNDICIYLCTKVKYPIRNLNHLVKPSYITKTTVVKWSNNHIEKE